MKKKIALTGAMLVAVIGLLSVSGFLVHKSLTAPSSLFDLESGSGAQGMSSLDQYIAIVSFVVAVAILAFIKKYWASK